MGITGTAQWRDFWERGNGEKGPFLRNEREKIMEEKRESAITGKQFKRHTRAVRWTKQTRFKA